MKLLLTSLIIAMAAVPSLYAYESDYEACMTKAHLEHLDSTDGANKELSRDMQFCYRYPVGTDFYACQSDARRAYNKKVKRFDTALEEKSKACN